MPAREIESLDCELAVYRKGFVSVHINLARGYLTWRESNRWAHNFTKTLHPEQIDLLRSNLSQCDWMMNLPLQCEDPNRSQASRHLFESGDSSDRPAISLTLHLKTASGYRLGSGNSETSLPADWQIIKRSIETLSRLPFELR